jgi:hypothetical protein
MVKESIKNTSEYLLIIKYYYLYNKYYYCAKYNLENKTQKYSIEKFSTL